MVNSAPFSSITGSGVANRPRRIFGPCRSATMPTPTPSSAAARRTFEYDSACTECSPWDMLRRATFMPDSMSSLICSYVETEGPRVQTILARRMRAGY